MPIRPDRAGWIVALRRSSPINVLVAGKFTGMMTSNGRSGEGRRAQRSAGQWLIGLLIALALAASVLMVINDEMSLAGSLAVIAALWAAVIAAILVTKFRRQAEGAEAKSRDLRLVYELQLEREIAARRQYELDVESTIRREVADEANHELYDLRQQIASLRAGLEVLLGGPLPDQGIALPNERVRQLGTGGYVPDDGLRAAQDFAATAPSRYDSHPSSTTNADPNEMTEVIPVVTDDEPVSAEFAAVDHPAYAQHDADPDTGQQEYPHQAYSYQERATPIYPESEVYPGHDYVPEGQADQDYAQAEFVAQSGRPTDLESTAVFNRSDIADGAPVDPAATTQFLPVESGRDYHEDIGEYRVAGPADVAADPGADEAAALVDDMREPGAGEDAAERVEEQATAVQGPADQDPAVQHRVGPVAYPEPADVEPAEVKPTSDGSGGEQGATEPDPSGAMRPSADPAGDEGGYHGSHEAAPDTEGFTTGRRSRRRRLDDGGESAHTGGMPVSELLSQLRGESADGYRRRGTG